MDKEELDEAKEMMELMKVWELENLVTNLREPELLEYCFELLDKRR